VKFMKHRPAPKCRQESVRAVLCRNDLGTFRRRRWSAYVSLEKLNTAKDTATRLPPFVEGRFKTKD
jgi:hypothetical protein